MKRLDAHELNMALITPQANPAEVLIGSRLGAVVIGFRNAEGGVLMVALSHAQAHALRNELTKALRRERKRWLSVRRLPDQPRPV